MCPMSSCAAAAEGLAASIIETAIIQTLSMGVSVRPPSHRRLVHNPLTACGSVTKSQSISGAVSIGSEPIC